MRSRADAARRGERPRARQLAAAAIALCALSALATAPAGAVPETVSYQGRLAVDGTPYTGDAEFKFVILPGGGAQGSLWSNDGTSVNGSEPSSSVTVAVSEGIFSVILGAVPMDPITADALSDAAENLRIWVDTGSGFEQLSDQPLASVPSALNSETAGRALGDFTAAGEIHSLAGGFRFPDGTLQTTASAGGGGGNTLDQAYDQGGAGAGRTITADAGKVRVAGPDGLQVDGYVGIGTDTPGRRLEVEGTSSFYEGLRLEANSGSGSFWDMLVSGPDGLGEGALSFWNGGHRLVMLENGNLGVGTFTPDSRLHVSGVTHLDGDARFDDDAEFYAGATRTARISGLGVQGGSIRLHRSDGVENVTLVGSFAGGDDASWMALRDAGSERVTFAARNGATGLGGLIDVKNDNAFPTIRLMGDRGSQVGGVQLNNAAGVENFLLLGSFSAANDGAWMALKDSGSERITFAARNGDTNQGGLIDVKNNAAFPTIRLIGDDGDGDGRIITSVLQITGGSDLSEPFEMDGPDEIPAGAVVVIDPERPGRLRMSDRAYDRRVAGVVSGAGGVRPGLLMSQQHVLDGGRNVALTGRVYALADASSGAIEPGDLLTTSSRPGHAMRASDHERAHGAVIGKAMSSLASGQGLVLVLVNLQ